MSGGTASGKTSLLNVLSLFIRPSKKIVSIEDTAELRLPHPHWIPAVARESITEEGEKERGGVDLFDLLKVSFRQRPDYIIVGEVRGKGLMQGVEIVADKKTRKPFQSSVGASGAVSAECMKRGLVVYPAGGMVNGVEGDNFLVAPPLIVNENHIKEIVSILEESLTAASDALLKGGINGKKDN